MGAVKYDEKTQSFEITYGGRENPFTGVDSSAPDPYISPGGHTKNSSNALVIDNSLIATNWIPAFDETYAITEIVLGIGDLLGTVFVITYNTSSLIISLYTYPNFPTGVGAGFITSITIPNYSGSTPTPTPNVGSLAYKNINGVCFFSFEGCPYILQHNLTSMSILTDYLGASFLNELDGRLIALDIFQFNSGSSGGTQYNGVGTSNANVNLQAGGSRTAFGSAITFPSQAVSGQISVTCNLSATENLYQGSGTIEVQYSIDNGSTWQTPFSKTTSTSGNPSYPNLQFLVNGLTNLNTLQIRAVASASVNPGGNASVNCTISTSAASVNSGGSTVATITEYPYQMAWSAPLGNYAQFSPLDSNSLVTGAGFNNLPDVEDFITGYFNVGPTGYIIRSQGITEVSPLSNGINPFDFNHLWASHKGIGSIYSDTVSQYGSIGAFFAETGVYTIGYDGINDITGKARTAIFNDLIIKYGAKFICGGLGPVLINGDSFLVYCLAVYNSVNQNAILYLYRFDTQEWYRFIVITSLSTGLGFSALNTNITIGKVNSLNFFTDIASGGLASFSLPLTGSVAFVYGSSNIVLSAEELMFMRDITIDAIGIYYSGSEFDPGKVQCLLTINGIEFTILNDTNLVLDGSSNYILAYPLNNEVCFTGKTPQLTINISSTHNDDSPVSFNINKLVIFGSADSSQRPA